MLAGPKASAASDVLHLKLATDMILVSSDELAARVLEGSEAGAPGSAPFLMASASLPVSTQSDPAAAAAYRPGFPQIIERFSFFPTMEGLSVGVGADYSSGKYGGTSRIDTVSIPLIVKYEAEKWGFKLTIPHVKVTESETYADNWGDIIHYHSTESGLGDIGAAVTYYAYDNPDFTAGVDFTGKIKFGTADTGKGLGNGKNDYAVQVNGYHTTDKVTVFGTAGYRILGQPAGATLHNVLYGSLGGGYKCDPSTRFGFALDQRQKSSERGSLLREFSVYVSYGYNKNWNVQGYLLKGLANGSPDFGGGAAVSHSLNP